VVISGNFTTVNGTARLRAARLNADGSLDSGFGAGLSINSVVNAVALQTDGKVLIGGNFVTVNTISRPRIARLNTDGSLDTNFLNGVSGASAAVNAIAVQADGKVIVGGSF